MSISRVRARRRFLLLLAIGLLTFVVFLVVSTLNKRALSPLLSTFESEADIRVRSFSLVETENGSTPWTLRAAEAEFFEKINIALLRGITVTLPYGDEGEIRVKGDKGEIEADKKNFFIQKNKGLLKVELENHYSVETSGLKWDNGKRTLFSQGSVHISGLEAEINGNELAILVDKGELTVTGDVKALVY